MPSSRNGSRTASPWAALARSRRSPTRFCSSPRPPPASSPAPRSSSMAAGSRGEMMYRRAFLIAASAAALIPKTPAAQQGCCRVVGVLAPNPKVFATLNMEGDFRELGWEPGRDYRLLFRTSESSSQALPRLAAELVAQKADVIFAAGDQAVIAAQQATTAIPIVGVCDDMV